MMGWCSGTRIFDEVCSVLLEKEHKPKLPQKCVEEVITVLTDAMEDMDWDCQGDSRFVDHPVVKKIFIRRHPGWYE